MGNTTYRAYWGQYERKKAKILFSLWTHIKFPIPDTHGWAIGRLFLVLWRKDTAIYRECIVWGMYANMRHPVHRFTKQTDVLSQAREVSKPRNSGLNFSNHSEIWQAPRKHRCRDAFQIPERCDHHNTQSHGSLETSRFGGKTSYRLSE